MQDGYRILESGKSGKMAKRYQHHKLPSCLGYPKHEGKDEENLTHFFGHYRLVRPVGLFRAPIKPLKPYKWQPSTPPHGGDGGGFPLVCGGFPPNKKAPTLAGAFNLQEEVSYLSSFM